MYKWFRDTQRKKGEKYVTPVPRGLLITQHSDSRERKEMLGKGVLTKKSTISQTEKMITTGMFQDVPVYHTYNIPANNTNSQTQLTDEQIHEYAKQAVCDFVMGIKSGKLKDKVDLPDNVNFVATENEPGVAFISLCHAKEDKTTRDKKPLLITDTVIGELASQDNPFYALLDFSQDSSSIETKKSATAPRRRLVIARGRGRGPVYCLDFDGGIFMTGKKGNAVPVLKFTTIESIKNSVEKIGKKYRFTRFVHLGKDEDREVDNDGNNKHDDTIDE